MNKTFKYSPPLKYLFSIPLGLLGGVMFTFIAFAINDIIVQVFAAFFALLFFAYAIGFYLRSFKNYKGFKIEIDNQIIKFPFSINGKNIQLKLDKINKVEKFENFEGETIEIYSKLENRFIELEEKWMKKDDFKNIYHLLKNKAKQNKN